MRSVPYSSTTTPATDTPVCVPARSSSRIKTPPVFGVSTAPATVMNPSSKRRSPIVEMTARTRINRGQQRDERVVGDRTGHERDALGAHLVDDRARDRPDPSCARADIETCETVETRTHTTGATVGRQNHRGDRRRSPATRRRSD